MVQMHWCRGSDGADGGGGGVDSGGVGMYTGSDMSACVASPCALLTTKKHREAPLRAPFCLI